MADPESHDYAGASISKKEPDQRRIVVITDLPNDFMISVLSLLTTKEAARTSLVVQEWRYLWTQLWSWRRELNLNGWDVFSANASTPEEQDALKQGFVKFMNQVLVIHKAETVEEFKICFMLDKSFSREIDQWVKFAFSKRVEVFELDFSSDRRGPCSKRENHRSDQPSITLPLIDFKNFDRLKALYLKYVDVDQEIVEYFLANFPSLEILHVKASNLLFGLRITGPSPRLKNFELSDCLNLKDLRIYAPNLISFGYTGCKCETLNIMDAPLLTELVLGISGRYVELHGLVRESRAFHCCFNQLETLELKDLKPILLRRSPIFPKLARLKKLIIHMSADDDEVILHLLLLIEAAPSLHEFRMMLDARYSIYLTDRRLLLRAIGYPPHQCLKVVEIVGFVGREIDTEFLLSIFDHAVSLEKVILDSDHPASARTPFKGFARRSANLLKSLAPASVDVLIC